MWNSCGFDKEAMKFKHGQLVFGRDVSELGELGGRILGTQSEG